MKWIFHFRTYGGMTMEHIPIVVLKNGELWGTYPNLQKLHKYMKIEFSTYTDKKLYDIINHGIDDLKRKNLNGDIYEFRTKEEIRLNRAERKSRSYNTDLSDHYKSIKRIEASIGGYFGSSYSLEVEFITRKITYEVRKDGNVEPSLSLQMDNEGVVNLRDELTKCRILDWNKEYIDSDTMDGTQWSLDIELDDRTIHINGSNEYPKEWNRFCKVIQKLIGKPFE
jgi:hypothetical protein